MHEADINQRVQVKDVCSLATVRRLAAMLDLNPEAISVGDVLPRGWHFFLLAGETRRSALRPDGFPGLGVPIPDLGLPRLLLGSRSVSYQGDLVIGSDVERTSFVRQITEKKTPSGPIAIVKIEHELRSLGGEIPAIVETQTYILLGGNTGATKAEPTPAQPVQTDHQKVLVPDETLLFQYSALGFNSHKIHLDRDYARTVEGLPDLVVNGGLSTLLLTEFIRTDLGLVPTHLNVKHVAPLFCGRPLTLTATPGEAGWQLTIVDDTNRVAVIVEANLTNRS